MADITKSRFAADYHPHTVAVHDYHPADAVSRYDNRHLLRAAASACKAHILHFATGHHSRRFRQPVRSRQSVFLITVIRLYFQFAQLIFTEII